MNEYIFARLIISKSGHDKGRIYIIIDSDEDYVYLADGRLRKLSNLKKKNKKHVQLTNYISDELIEKKEKNLLIDEDVKRIIKLYNKEHFHLA